MINPMDLTGKRILLVGKDEGINHSILLQLKALSADVVLYDKTDISGIESDIKVFKNEKISFDGMVYGIVKSDFRPLQFVRPEIVQDIISDNFSLFIEIIRCLKKSRCLKDNSSIVAMSSISSIRAMKAKMAFCSSKAALDAAVRCLAVELADKGIRVNSIQKGGVDVDFEKEHIKNIDSINNGATEQNQPLGITKAEEIANVAAFLLSDATRTITGTSIVIDGGYTL